MSWGKRSLRRMCLLWKRSSCDALFQIQDKMLTRMNSSNCERVKAMQFANAGPAVIPHTGCSGSAMDEGRKREFMSV